MRVRRRHIGRMCRCTQCKYPMYVTPDLVTPPIDPSDEDAPRVFSKDDIPFQWEPGDLLMEMYEVREVIGRGGMGVVYRVHHRGWDVDLAVKCPLEKYLTVKDWADTFEHECETWINLAPHRNTVKCYYFRRLGGVPRVFVEYVKGNDLWHRIAQKELYEGGHEVALPRMLDIAIQFAWGLNHAHREGLIHQDVKPSNVLVSDKGLVKVTDFGMARVKIDESEDTSDANHISYSGPKGGTLQYRSPDRDLQGEVTDKADIWSWGVSAIEMFAGKLFWSEGAYALKVLDQVVRGGYRRKEAPPMPKGLEEVLKRCFKRDPEKRPDSMGDVADDLLNLYEEVASGPYPREEPKSTDPTQAILNNRAVSLLDLDKSKESEALWGEVLATNPDHLEAEFNRDLRYWRTGRITDIDFIDKLQRVCRSREENSLAPCLLARVLIERGDSQAAIEILEKLTESGSYRREAAVALALAERQKKRDIRLVWKIKAHSTRVTAVCISFDGWRALTGSADGLMRMWELTFGKSTVSFKGHTGQVTSVCLSEDEKFVLSASRDGTLKVWDSSTGRCLSTLTGHTDSVTAAALSRDGRLALSAGEDHAVKLWDIGAGDCIQTFDGHKAAVNSVAFTRDGSLAVSGSSDHSIRMWDIETGRCLSVFPKNSKEVFTVSVGGDPPIAMSGSGQKVKFWNLTTETLTRSFRGHNFDVRSVSLTDDARYGISATPRGTIKIWDIATGQCLRSLRGHAPAALSLDGRYIITGKKNGTFRVWAVNLDAPPLTAPYLICREDDSMTGIDPSEKREKALLPRRQR